MKIATILPIAHLNLEKFNDYHLCLAHLLGDIEYHNFFWKQQDKYVIMDNGVVETGKAMPIKRLISLAKSVGATEMVLPDEIHDCSLTLQMAHDAMYEIKQQELDIKIMAVPQGRNLAEWQTCVREYLRMGIDCIGISRFIVKYISREEALASTPELLESKLDIHLLGCPNRPQEIADINARFGNRIRGVDSGVATMYTQEGIRMSDGENKPDVELHFFETIQNQILLVENVEYWRRSAIKGEK